MSILKTPISAVIAVGVLGCAGQNYAYRPETMNAVSAAGLLTARTPVPQERPEGSVEVGSYGVTDLPSGGTQRPALHVRMTVSNDGDAGAWRIDPGHQLIQIPGEGRSAPMYVNGEAHARHSVEIAPAQRRVLDLYYPLPATIQNDAHLHQFDFLWQVATPARTVTSRETFDRIAVETDTRYAALCQPWPLWSGYGPNWWYDPFYPGTAYIHPQVVGTEHRFPPSASRDLRGYYRPRDARLACAGADH